jgi:hypothetical protein
MDQVETVLDVSQGTVFTFIAPMEYKHKSEVATQQEERRIRSEILKEDKVVVLNLLLEEDVAVFRSAIANICQVIHECVTCKTDGRMLCSCVVAYILCSPCDCTPAHQ